MSTAQNPFRASMTKLAIPPHMGSSISVAGFQVDADADGTIEVPKEHVTELLAHGLTLHAPAADAKAKAK